MRKLKSLILGLAVFFGVESSSSACFFSTNACQFAACMVDIDNGYAAVLTDVELYALAIFYYQNCWFH